MEQAAFGALLDGLTPPFDLTFQAVKIATGLAVMVTVPTLTVNPGDGSQPWPPWRADVAESLLRAQWAMTRTRAGLPGGIEKWLKGERVEPDPQPGLVDDVDVDGVAALPRRSRLDVSPIGDQTPSVCGTGPAPTMEAGL